MFPDYEVVVVTGDKLNAGTKANVFMTLFGKTGVTPKIRLHNNTKSVFDRGSSDVFLIHTNCVGPMTKLRIEHDGTGMASGWYVERVSRCLWKEGNVLFNDTLTHSTHFIYGYMVSDIWLRTILIVRKENRCHHIGYSFRLTARVLLYAPSHRQDSTYHGLCYTTRGALAGTRNNICGVLVIHICITVNKRRVQPDWSIANVYTL